MFFLNIYKSNNSESTFFKMFEDFPLYVNEGFPVLVYFIIYILLFLERYSLITASMYAYEFS